MSDAELTRPGVGREEVDAAAADRLRLRYPPPRVPRAVKVALVAVGAAVGVGWLVWAGLVHANPVAAAQVAAYTVRSDTRIDVTVTVDRRDPAVPVTCRVVAQASDFSAVGELEVPIATSTFRVVDSSVTLTTLRRATTATVQGCRAT